MDSDTRSDTNSMAPTFHDDRLRVRKGGKEMKLDYPCWFWPFITHWLGFISIEG